MNMPLIIDKEKEWYNIVIGGYLEVMKIESEYYDWCFKNVGNYSDDWAVEIKNGKVIFYFKYQENAMFFKLRFGGFGGVRTGAT